MRGFSALPISAYVALAAGAVILVLGIGLKVQGARLDACRAEYASFVADVKAKGEAAQKAAKAQETADKRRKERADAEAKRLRADNATLAASLRDARSRGGYLPRPATGSASPDRITFKRAELERAIERLDAGVSGIAAAGDDARIGLDAVRAWAQESFKAP
jgi:hypothetical protein